MAYQYYSEIVNNNEVSDFFSKDTFVGYILPNGQIYPCVQHNIEGIDTYLRLSLYNLKNHFADKDQILVDTDDEVGKIVVNYLKKLSYDEICKLDSFISQNKLSLSDLMVQLFNCHLVTRLKKRIITSNPKHDLFYNYLLMGFSIDTIPRIYYVDNDFKFVESHYHNDSLYEEINEIVSSTKMEDKALFFK